ncbi:WD40 repeat domain-containing serine/threonine protein kinase [Nocardiopsis listeri]|uniref:WD40 repeat domain-containing serine/threonine protein kinase n=1 Tax=Nocardiopsis listeri TaxID=53440 RepID=UPI000833C8A8|nr:serine/threonine-protein kinase [Nocardiopsis listeri]
MRPLTADDPPAIGPHRLLARLGAGGMGEVYLARTPDGHLCALKVVKEDLAHDSEFRARFAREVRTAQRVRGPFTPAVVDADPEAPKPWMATEYVPGPTLKEAVREVGHFPAESLLVLTLGLARALATIHTAGLMHRDLKPGNILLSPRGPQVIDFGIARAVEGTVLTRTGQTFGTPSYTSPEQITGKNVTSRADVFSLGGAVIFAACGTPPFGVGSPVNALAKVLKAEPNLEVLPEGPLRDLIARCMAKEPEQRPDTASILRELSGLPLPSAAHGWLPAQVNRQIDAKAGETEQARAAERTTAPVGNDPGQGGGTSWWRRRSVVIAATAVTALVLLGGGALAWTALPPGSEDGPDPTAGASEEPGGESGEGSGGEGDGSAEESDHFSGFMYTLTFSEDGEHLHVFGSGTLSTWDWREGELIDEYPTALGADFTDSGYVATAVNEYVRVWEGGSDNRITVLGQDEEFGMFDMAALTEDASTLASEASDDGTEDGDPILHTWDVESEEVVSTVPLDGYLHALDYTPDGSMLVGASYNLNGEDTAFTIVWDTESGEELHRFEGEEISDFALSADGSTLVVLMDYAEVLSVDLTDGSTREMDMSGLDEDNVYEVALSADGSIVYGGTSWPTADTPVWDAATGEVTPVDGLRLSEVIGVSADGEHIATTVTEGGHSTVRVLDTTDHEVVAEFS